MNKGIANSAFKRIVKFLKRDYPNYKISPKRRPSITKYCHVLNIPPPIKKKTLRFLFDEYYREGSPIFKGIEFPVEKRKSTINKKRRLSYITYLDSSKWKMFKAKLKMERGDKCEHCQKSGVTLDGHHVTYERLFNELPEDVLLLCRLCHKKVHNK